MSCLVQSARPSLHSNIFGDLLHTHVGLILILPEDGSRIQSTKRCVLTYKQDGVLDKNRTVVNVQKHNICTNAFVCLISICIF
jgi:hypothetical protein